MQFSETINYYNKKLDLGHPKQMDKAQAISLQELFYHDSSITFTTSRNNLNNWTKA